MEVSLACSSLVPEGRREQVNTLPSPGGHVISQTVKPCLEVINRFREKSWEGKRLRLSCAEQALARSLGKSRKEAKGAKELGGEKGAGKPMFVG